MFVDEADEQVRGRRGDLFNSQNHSKHLYVDGSSRQHLNHYWTGKREKRSEKSSDWKRREHWGELWQVWYQNKWFLKMLSLKYLVAKFMVILENTFSFDIWHCIINSRAGESASAWQRRWEPSKGPESRSRIVYAKLESNSEPERARVCQRVAVRASESQSGSHREP